MTRRASISKKYKIKQLALAEARIVKRITVFIGLVILSFLLYHIDVFTGHWKFHALCKNEGGIKIYEPLRGNVGWMRDKPYKSLHGSPSLSFRFREKFIRYVGYGGNKFDAVEVLPPLPSRIYIKNYDSYIISPADNKETVVYRNKELVERDYSGDKRFRKYQERIIDIANQKIVATYTYFGFEWIKRERLLFPSAGTEMGCDKELPSFPTYRDFYTAVNSTME